ncbi:hypothetical protein GUITHDRAFT_118366 [Guillardia theta CCMP2712]|uniref:Inositol-1-monophosphatase n=2 Tax=Guillardia theta TaxID=55529 RepID=L1II13_GUITC|nr:hypothetical protein GUITHDRAFT_118366 [Guillardia theta CCMP2712]EKX35450.1 hypothetical protein GUITHDRAFT_118366 [Guillardia theta CCMP2712]|eukprot:XP_005822430.1 hypothetical protein GUITHDRAFT_118366 [Guillardia theta CCMP2712]
MTVAVLSEVRSFLTMSAAEEATKEVDLDLALQVAIEGAKGAGGLILKSFRKDVVNKKKSLTDPVTEVDLACEDLLRALIAKHFPTHKFLGEESFEGSYNLSDDPTWVVDPIDGTANFVHGLQWTCVSVALVVDKMPMVGVVFNPVTQEMYKAVRGKGAFMNDEKISPSQVEDMPSACICTEFGANRDPEVVQKKVDIMHKVIQSPVQALRCLGSCALNMCAVASGNVDGYYEWGMHPWDVAAAFLICTEAGAVVTDLDGSAFSITARRTLVANAKIQPQLKKIIMDAGAPMQPSVN